MRLVIPLVLAGTVVAGALAIGGSATAHPTSDRSTRTHRVVLRPVDRHGDPVQGWKVKRERGTSVSCGGAAAAAVSRNIVECFPTAEYLPACWKSSHHTVLCVRDATRHQLVRIRYSGSIGSVSAPKHPAPQDLRLTGGQKCEIRVGGAWAQLPTHPHWVGFYSCRSGSVYGPAKGDGVDRSASVWTVQLWLSGTKHHVVTRDVGTAYFVGTHR
jgi:hypothetical protein